MNKVDFKENEDVDLFVVKTLFSVFMNNINTFKLINKGGLEIDLQIKLNIVLSKYKLKNIKRKIRRFFKICVPFLNIKSIYIEKEKRLKGVYKNKLLNNKACIVI